MERIKFAIAWKLPRWLVYFASVRLIAYGTKQAPTTNAPELTAMDALSLWGTKR